MSNRAGKPKGPATATTLDREMVRVAVVFLAAVAALESLLFALDASGVLVPVQEYTAAVAAWLIGIVGIEADRAGIDVLLAGHTLRITLDCTAAFVIAAHAALVIAFPATARRRVTGFLWGTAVLVIANLVRLVLVAFVATRFADSLDVVHDYLFHVALVLVTGIVWITWIGKVRRDA